MPEDAAPSLAPVLQALGLSPHERAVLAAILQTPGAGAGEVAKRSKLHRNQVYRALRSLEETGLIRNEGERPLRFFAEEGTPLRQRLEAALEQHERASAQVIEAWQRLGEAPVPGFSRTIAPAAMADEVQRFRGRRLVGVFDTWPLDYAPAPSAPRTITLAGRSAAPEARTTDAASPMRYLLATDACLLFEGPDASPAGQLLGSPAAVTVFRDHFELSWTMLGAPGGRHGAEGRSAGQRCV